MNRIKQRCLFYALIPISILSITCCIYGTGIIYLSKDFKNALHQVQEINCQYSWSKDFYSLEQYLKSGADFAQEELVSHVIEECFAMLDATSPDGSKLIEIFLRFKEEISSDYDVDNQFDGDFAENRCYKIDIDIPLVNGPMGSEDNSTVPTRKHHCCPRICCKQGPTGITGATGVTGVTGATGASGFGFLTRFGNFWATITTTGTTVALDAEVEFPSSGPTVGIAYNVASSSEFVLPAIGIYEVNWQVLVDEEGQLALYLNGLLLAQTTVGRRTGSCQIVGSALISTSVANSILSIRNPGPAPLTIVQNDFGTLTENATLTIKQIA